MKKLKKYKLFLTIYSSLLILLMIFSLSYVYISLSKYEKNQPETFIKEIVKQMKNNPSKYATIKDEHIEGYKNMLKNEKITIEEIDDHYELQIEGTPIFTVKLDKGKSETKLGLLTYKILSLKEIKTISDNGAYYYKIKIPSSFTLKVNDNTFDTVSEKVDNEEFKDMETDVIPKDHIYELKNLKEKPKIEIFNNNNELVEYKSEDGFITSHEFYKTDNYKDKVKNPIDILEFSRNWSLYFTKDLKGGNKGFDTLKPYLIQDSKMWNSANQWITSIDRTYVSLHSLKNPVFTNESVSDCHIYSDSAFSCIIKLEKNMIVAGKDKIDTLHDRMFFVNDNGWKFIDMIFISE